MSSSLTVEWGRQREGCRRPSIAVPRSCHPALEEILHSDRTFEAQPGTLGSLDRDLGRSTLLSRSGVSLWPKERPDHLELVSSVPWRRLPRTDPG